MKAIHQGRYNMPPSIQNESEQWDSKSNHLQSHQESSSQSNWSNKLSQNFQRNFQLMKDEYRGLRDQWKSGEAVKDLSDRQSLRQHCKYIRDSAQSSWDYYRKHIWHQQFHSQDQSGRRGSLINSNYSPVPSQ
ncbi:hypothetical protein FGO68_gene8291 [Halteria grandinella]|uniref:Uncharacterized protein n=1 Tax=Halteria grandinella TaxID=5974 RepID=A0A8J8NP52_HALGN|nr:hypothetical protein FGO68_gene8291 [Halteria grandinella]